MTTSLLAKAESNHIVQVDQFERTIKKKLERDLKRSRNGKLVEGKGDYLKQA